MGLENVTLTFTVLGCNGSGPGPDGAASGYLVRTERTSIWMDAGTGTFMELTRYLDPADIDALLLSHIHADHSADIFGFVHYLAYRVRSDGRIPFYAPGGAAEALAAFLRAGTDHPFHHVLEAHEVLDELSVEIGEVSVGFAPGVHSVPANAIRVEHGGRVLVFSGDTGLGGGFPGLAKGAHLVVAEAGLTGPRGPDVFPLHLSAAEAAQIAEEAGAERLVLTHVASTKSSREVHDEAAAVFSGETIVAAPGLQLEV